MREQAHNKISADYNMNIGLCKYYGLEGLIKNEAQMLLSNIFLSLETKRYQIFTLFSGGRYGASVSLTSNAL